MFLRPAFVLLAIVALSLAASRSPAAALPPKPNIIVILSDDHGYGDMSHTDVDTGATTPNLDRLAASGVRFTHGYTTAPICTPSRIGLALGAYQQRFGNWWYGGPGLPEHAPTIAEVLSQAGYATAMIGKIHFSGHFDATVRNHPLNHGFDTFYGFNGPAKHYLVHSAERERVFLEKLRQHEPEKLGYPTMFYGPMWVDDRQVDEDGFSTHLFRDRAKAFIDANTGRPYFMLLSFNAVHDQSYQLPPDYLQAKGIPQPRDWDPAAESSAEWAKSVYSPERNRQYILGQLHFLDQAIGDLLDHLELAGQRDNTVVVYLSDNGGDTGYGSRNDPLHGSKFTMSEGGSRVPFLISWPGVFPEGKTMDNVISAMDLLPTAAALAGAEIPDTTDGLNLLPLFTGEDPALEHETLVWDAGPDRAGWAVRHGDWKLYFTQATTRHVREGAEPGFRLTDLANDPTESQNLILERPEKAAELARIHRRWLEEMLR